MKNKQKFSISEIKNLANNLYNSSDYKEALDKYTSAIMLFKGTNACDHKTKALLHSNRACVYDRLSKPLLSELDSLQCLYHLKFTKDETETHKITYKCLFRQASSHKSLGENKKSITKFKDLLKYPNIDKTERSIIRNEIKNLKKIKIKKGFYNKKNNELYYLKKKIILLINDIEVMKGKNYFLINIEWWNKLTQSDMNEIKNINNEKLIKESKKTKENICYTKKSQQNMVLSGLEYNKDYLLVDAKIWNIIKKLSEYNLEIEREILEIDGNYNVSFIDKVSINFSIINNDHPNLILSCLLEEKVGNIIKTLMEYLKYDPSKFTFQLINFNTKELLKENNHLLKENLKEKKILLEIVNKVNKIIRKAGNKDINKEVNKREELIGMIGLKNLGNSCYINSSVQCLNNIKELTNYFISDQYKNDINKNNFLGHKGKLVNCFADLLKEIWLDTESKEKSKFLDTKKFVKTIISLNHYFSGNNHHDAQEFLSFLLDGLHEDINLVKDRQFIAIEDDDKKSEKEMADTHWNAYIKRNNSHISLLFSGQFKSSIYCPKCKKTNTKFDPYTMISLPINNENRLYNKILFMDKKGDTYIPEIVYISYNKKDQIYYLKKKFGELKNIPDMKKIHFFSVFKHSIVRHLEVTDNMSSNFSIFSIKSDINQFNQSKNQVVITIDYYIKSQSGERTYFGYPNMKYFESSKIKLQELLKFINESKNMIKIDIKYNIHYKNIEIDKNDYAVFDGKFCKISLEIYEPINKIKEYMIECDNLDKKMKNDEINTLMDCFNSFTSEETLNDDDTWICNSCKKPVKAVKKMNLWRMPRILILHLKRFRFTHSKINNSAIKLDTIMNIKFSDINLTKFISNTKEENNIYSLNGIICHFGKMKFGHYMSYIKRESKWFHFDDETFARIEEKEVPLGSAYILFYVKVNSN